MAKWIRNCFLPKVATIDWGASLSAFFIREALLVGGWTEFANNGDAGWTSASNQIFKDDTGTPGFAVLAANPRRVTHSGNPFTTADVGRILALRASNDQNASMWRISAFIDTGTIEVDSIGFSPYGWTNESGIPGRILDYKVRIANLAWVEHNAPSGNNRSRMDIIQATGLQVACKPKAGLGDTTQTPASGPYVYDDDDLAVTLNAYFDGNNALFFKFADADSRLDVVMWGELDSTVTGDTWPGFVWCSNNATVATAVYPYNFRGDQLGYSSLPIQIYTDWITRENWNSNSSTNLDLTSWYRLVNGRPGYTRLRKPVVVLDNIATNGAFIRGHLPVVRFGTSLLSQYSPVDARGEWWHLVNGLFVPRNGPYDPQICTAYV